MNTGRWPGVISTVENELPEKDEILKRYMQKTGAYILGVTGSPGAGKSSLVDSLVRSEKKELVGILLWIQSLYRRSYSG